MNDARLSSGDQLNSVSPWQDEENGEQENEVDEDEEEVGEEEEEEEDGEGMCLNTMLNKLGWRNNRTERHPASAQFTQFLSNKNVYI